MGEEFDTEEQGLPTCPYCGYEDLAYFELDHDESPQVVECGKCGREYNLEIRCVACYTSTKKEANADGN